MAGTPNSRDCNDRAWDEVKAIQERFNIKEWTTIARGNQGGAIQVRPGSGNAIALRVIDQKNLSRFETDWQRGQSMLEHAHAVGRHERAKQSGGVLDVFCDNATAWFFRLDWSGRPAETFELKLLDS